MAATELILGLKMKLKLLKIIILLLTTPIVFNFSCAKRPNRPDADSPAKKSSAQPVVSWDGKGLEAFSPNIQGSGDAHSLAMALSDCDCASKSAADIMIQSSKRRGTLPQIFVPQIRQSIASDSKLQLLARFPILGGALKSWLATDEKIAGEIRSTIGSQLNQSLRSVGGTSLATRSAFRLDLFSPNSAQPTSFDLADQAVRWNVVFGRKALWTGGKPVDGVDHGLQLLEVTRIAAEWAYLAGIDSSGKPGGFGGLSLDVRTGNKQLAVPFDPTAAPQGAGLFVSGGFTISYPNAGAVDLATKVKESWAYRSDDVSLLTQARVWRAAALGFQNLRMDRSASAKAILNAKDGALSPAVQQLPLLWLPGMAELLEKRFIDKNARVIKQFAYGPATEANLETLLTLADALQQWRTATTHISNSNLSGALKAQLLDVPNQLLLPLQLTVQTIISRFTYVQGGDDLKVLVGSRGIPADNRQAAIAIRTLAKLEQEGLQSDELKIKVMSLFASHASTWTLAPGQVDAATMIEQYRAAIAVSNYTDAQPWVRQLRDKLGAAVAGWGGP